MGCTHYIINRYLEVRITATCYICGKEVDLSDPDEGHEDCHSLLGWRGEDEADDYPLPVDIEISNTRER